MAKTRIYFVSDLHGSSLCFRKFVNAAPIYGANVLVLGADLAGKAIQQSYDNLKKNVDDGVKKVQAAGAAVQAAVCKTDAGRLPPVAVTR